MHRSFARPRSLPAGMLPFLFAAGCFPSPGPCDQNAAFEVVYSPDGIPAIAGQAVMQTSCGNGGFCHSDSDIPLADRFGAPDDLGFDTRIAATTAFLCQDPACDAEDVRTECCNALEPDAARLSAHRDRITSMVGEILQQVQGGTMPPQGEALARYRAQIEGLGVRFDRIADDGVTPTRLPTLIDEDAADREAAQAILDNWLACGAPVIERTVARRGLENVSGHTFPACERDCVDVTWESIYRDVLEPTCTSSACHDAEFPAGDLDLSGGAGAVYGRIISRAASGSQCMAGGMGMIVGGDPDGSLLLAKLEASSSADVCGSRMPLSGSPLSEQRLLAIRQWIMLGAPEADAPAAELATARAAARFDPRTPSRCATAPSCANRLTP